MPRVCRLSLRISGTSRYQRSFTGDLIIFWFLRVARAEVSVWLIRLVGGAS